MSQKTEKTCKKGHHYLKSSDCPTCPICEEERKSDRMPPIASAMGQAGVFASLSAPARRAMENNGIHSLEQLAAYSEKQILEFHGVGKASLPALKTLLSGKGLSFKA